LAVLFYLNGWEKRGYIKTLTSDSSKEKLEETLSAIGWIFAGLAIWGAIGGAIWFLFFWQPAPDTTDPFISAADQVQDFHLKARITENNHTYTEPVIVHTNPCAGSLCLSTIQLTRINWPDGGYTTFQGCNVSGWNQSPVYCQAANSAYHYAYGIVLLYKQSQ
jgi:hypothetical protein